MVKTLDVLPVFTGILKNFPEISYVLNGEAVVEFRFNEYLGYQKWEKCDVYMPMDLAKMHFGLFEDLQGDWIEVTGTKDFTPVPTAIFAEHIDYGKPARARLMADLPF